MESTSYYKSLQPLPAYGTYGTTVTTVCMACYSTYGFLQLYSIFQGLLMQQHFSGHGHGGIIPLKPFLTLICLDRYPYTSLGVRVLAGMGKGTEKKPRGYPGHTLGIQYSLKSLYSYRHSLFPLSIMTPVGFVYIPSASLHHSIHSIIRHQPQVH
jgi:hypothetical protein